MIQNLILSIGLSFTIGLNGVKNNNDNFINNDIPNNVVYDDETYSITFLSDELQEYTWVNLCNIVGNGTNNYNTTNFFSENEEEYSYDDYISEDGSYALYYAYADNQIILNSSNHKNSFIFILENDYGDFGENFTWYLNNTIYDNIKTAIELDIQANTTQTSMGSSIINAIKSGLGLIGNLASQFLLGFSTLFWNSTNNTLTPFGTFALVMLGVAITMAIVSLVLNIIRNNTGA